MGEYKGKSSLWNNKKIISWSLYDWANSAFATTVMAGFFPVFFKKYWSVGTEVTASTFKLGLANSSASILIALFAPFLGAIADKANAKKKFLFFFAFLGVVMTGSLYLVGQGEWKMAVMLYILASIGFASGNIFYDALLVDVAQKSKFDMVSALGFSLGYLGGGLLLALNVFMTLSPQTFGLKSSVEAVRLSFITVALWWAVFSIPLFVYVKERKLTEDETAENVIFSGFKQLVSTLKKFKETKVAFIFLLSYWFYIDGVDTIIRMAVDYGMSIGFDEKNLILALLLVQFVGFPAALVFGKIGEKFGAKKGIYLAIAVYIVISFWGFFMDSIWEFYGLAVSIGLVQGGIQALSRSFYTSLIPKDKAAEFLGFYNMFGKFAVIFGPFLMGTIAVLTGNPRYSVFAVTFLLVVGAVILTRVPDSNLSQKKSLMPN
ncbi:MFS transporter [Candidatus Margulisiibacteriota bacterium]